KKRRSLTDFLPFFSSTTSSMGTRMRPNFSFISERSIRSRRLRSTAFSMPEYAWTTYQRLCPVATNDSGGCVSALVSVTSNVSRDLALPAEDEVVQHPLERLVCQPEKERHDDDEGEHVGGHLQCFLARRPDDLANLANRILAVGDELLAGFRREERGHGNDQQHDERGDAHPQVLLAQHVESHHRADDEQARHGELGLVGAARYRLDAG